MTVVYPNILVYSRIIILICRYKFEYTNVVNLEKIH